ncbi:Serine/threonine-protein kinase pim-1 [Bagarius yarrelli]|uniref:non-specific serine/threonine protein kinase n=1 Tax=Bagarius yarrelli TaxID=175774 RepID=A0A556VW13_BAGYA|nr:Serine/threonine-protein kinase pim-1 [Bagarius yarrelli]
MKIVSEPPRCENVVELLEWFETSGFYILVLERPVPCMDLFKICELNNGRMSEALAHLVMWQVVQAVDHCCKRGVLHRDIKPENILINPETLHVKLIDFGCGDLLMDELYTNFTGTPSYWPPEWILHGKYYGIAATVWSLGIVLFFLVCGELPFVDTDEITDGQLWLFPDVSDGQHHFSWFLFTL